MTLRNFSQRLTFNVSNKLFIGQCLVPLMQLFSIVFAFSSVETCSKLSSEGNRRTVEEFLWPPSSEANRSNVEHSVWCGEGSLSCSDEATAVRNQDRTLVAVFIEHCLFVVAMMTRGGNTFTLQCSGSIFLTAADSIISSLRIKFVMVEISAVVILEMRRPSGWIITLCVLSSSDKLIESVFPFSITDSGIAEVIIRENSPRLLKLYLLWLCKYDEYCATTCPDAGCFVDWPFSCISSHDFDEKELS